MAKRGYKLQEFLAHSANVNCLSIGKKTSRLFITGGDDYKVNLWAIGKPTNLMSLCGHTSAVDSVAFDSAEVLVLAGASSGVIKLWDVEEAKMVRAFTGHRSNCSAVEFHPFGEFLASGSTDANLKIWDIRKKGCIQTYKGHTRGINTIRFTPDGRWVVSGGLDNVVKVWDLTAGKPLHESKFHEGPISSLDFHPLEFLLATGSADRTVKFWDLETFELIGSTRPEATGVRSIKFHPDGRTLFCGLDDSLKVYSWEPIVSHDGVDMGWSTLGNLCISEGKLLGCSYYQNSVGIWVSDISQIEPYGIGSADKKECVEKILSALDDQSSDRIRSSPRRSSSPDYETKEIKNIYIDSAGGNSAVAHKSVSLITPKVKATSTGQEVDNKSLILQSVVPWDCDIGKDSSDSGKESITFAKTKPGMLLRPAHVRKTPTKYDETKQSVAVQSEIPKKSASDDEKKLDTETAFDSERSVRKPFDVDDSIIKSITNKFEQALLPESPTGMLLKPPRVQRSPSTKFNEARCAASVDSGALDSKLSGLESPKDIDLPAGLKDDRGSNPCEDDIDNKSISSRSERVLSPEKAGGELKSLESPGGSKGSNSVKVVRGVKVVSGRTRSLVERFERGEKITHSEDKAASATIVESSDAVEEESQTASVQAVSTTPTQVMPVKLDQATNSTPVEAPVLSTRRTRSTPVRVMPVVLGRDTNMATDAPPVTSTRPDRTSSTNLISDVSCVTSTRQAMTSPAPVMPMILNQTSKLKSDEPPVTSTRPDRPSSTNLTSDEPGVTSTRQDRTSPAPVMPMILNQTSKMKSDEPAVISTRPDRPSSTSLASDESGVTSTRQARTSPAPVMPMIPNETSKIKSVEPPVTSTRPDRPASTDLISDESSVTSTRQAKTSPALVTPVILSQRQKTNMKSDEPPVISRRPLRTSSARVMPVILNQASNSYDERPVSASRSARNSPARVMPMKLNQAENMTSYEPQVALTRSARNHARVIPGRNNQASNLASNASHIRSRQRYSPTQTLATPAVLDQVTDMTLDEAYITETQPACDFLTQEEEPQISGRENDGDIWETLMETHNEVLNTLQSRLTKVQVNFVSAILFSSFSLILTLDLFSQLAPVLTGLLGSRTERPVNVSLEMLLKLVAVFGTVIQSTVSARRVVGVDLHAEERLQMCQSCSAELQKVHKILPLLTRRGGLIARKAQELNLVLQTP
ncbi:PREDICTED: katanin p80 WD40 repeat-containing subunit B1 homolog isoform X1 [Camelina sativa]|uniref:Katanin p80 WD40 repeat-containing subunit B1 homolog n=1 Tax=Camelina sativa TaxID=90675 RepID=A0ABM0SYS7_CAMSA|nr:PREDICTED: katanin p80 WD40 repeat-containing subunit B1 homolog isoform X1 [Camelina sativa]